MLDRLRRAVRDVTARADQHERDYTTRATKLRAQFEQALSSERVRATTEIEGEKAAAEAARGRIEAAFAARKSRIARALESARKRKLAEIEAEEGRRTLEVQHGLLEADQIRDAETQANTANCESFFALLSEEETVLHRTEARARSTLGGYRSLARRIGAPATVSPDVTAHEHRLLEQLRARIENVERELSRCRRLVLPLWFKFLPLWLWVLLIVGLPFAFVPALRQFDLAAVPARVWGIQGGCFAVTVALYFLGRALVAPRANAVATALAEARKLHEACRFKAECSFQQAAERIRAAHTGKSQALNARWKQAQAEARKLRAEWSERLDQQARQLLSENEDRRRWLLARRYEEHTARLAHLHQEAIHQARQLETSFRDTNARLNTEREAARKAIESDWQNLVLPLHTALRAAAEAAQRFFPPWQPEQWQQFKLPAEFVHAAKFAGLAVDVETFCGVSLPGKGLVWPAPSRIEQPLLLDVPRAASVLFETKQSGQTQVLGALNNLVLRLLTSAPPGRLTFTIFDPVGLGQHFAGIMHLADFEERVINSRIWTQPAQFEQRLAELNEHIEKVTQMYLRNEYETLAEYNAQAGRMAEKYHFLVIADFPVNFSDMAVKRLQSIIASGPRCGVHTFIHWDQRRPAPVELVPEELRKNSLRIVPKADRLVLAEADWPGTELALEAPPDAELATRLLQQIGQASVDSYRVEMPFAEVAPAEAEFWTLDTTRELRVGIGRTGATKQQYLSLGQGTRQHGLIAGKTGSGKSTLFHVIITNLALWCSPEQVEFYLVDFKKGVEFKCYATHKLPHARVVAIESDREFGLSVLQRVDEELKRRGDLFRKLGAQDLAGYKRAGGAEAIPRTLLIIDEFQEFFVEDDRIAQGASLLLDRIVRQGRAFGIHVLLGSQTLGGAYTLARATIGQMVVRIALQCNEADAYLIMNEDNPAPRLLSRPGEAIYNDDGGSLQGNSPFQVVWLPDEVREDWLSRVRHRAEAHQLSGREPVVFEGNAPANVRDNAALRQLLEAERVKPTSSPRLFLGAPNSIKGPTEAVLRRQSGSHLLVVGQREEAALGLIAISLIALAAQHPRTAARFLVFDSSAPDSAEARFLERVLGAIPHDVNLVRPVQVDEVMAALAADLRQRAEHPAAAGPEVYLLIHGLERNKKLRFDEEMSFSLDADAGANPGLQLNKLICEGASLGFHVIATCDTYNNVMRMVSRKALSEFEMRVVFQMSANDSASLIDSPAANHLGLHRAILFNGQEGWLETFRPYALADEAWLAAVQQHLARLHRLNP